MDCVCMYVCMHVSFYVWVMSHQSDWGYYTALESDTPMKWPVQTVHSWRSTKETLVSAILKTLLAENIWTISRYCPTEISSSLCALFVFFNLLIFPASVKLIPYMRRSLGKTTCDDAIWSWDSSILMILFTSFVLQDFVMRTKWIWSLSELIINRKWIKGLYFLKLVLSQ